MPSCLIHTFFCSFSFCRHRCHCLNDLEMVVDVKMTKRRTLLLMDEIHRFTKNQQDAFLPIIENGTIVLLGATTENPSFSLNSALLSRCKVVVLNALTPRDVRKFLERVVDYFNSIVVDEGDGKSKTGSSKLNASSQKVIVADKSHVGFLQTPLMFYRIWPTGTREWRSTDWKRLSIRIWLSKLLPPSLAST